MDPSGTYPIIVVITSLRFLTRLLAWERGKENCLLVSSKVELHMIKNNYNLTKIVNYNSALTQLHRPVQPLSQ